MKSERIEESDRCGRQWRGVLEEHHLCGAGGAPSRRFGPCSVYALAKEVERNYSNVHTDVAKLEEHGLVQRTPEDAVFVPFESVEIHLALFKRAAAQQQNLK